MADLDSKKGTKPRGTVWGTVTAPLRAIVSPPAQRAYLGTLFYLTTVFFLLGASIVAYWAFYYNFVPQISLERPVHLQFGDDHPFGTALIGPELAHSQAYDVSVVLYLPRTPSNLAAGNFMLDLELLGESKDPTEIEPGPTILHMRKPGIMTFSSSLVDTARRISRMPFYILNWKREAETLRINMIERVEFSKGKKHVPKSLRLEIQSRERMQIYTATVKFDAKFTGLRWLMYNWRIFSFVVFSSTFWFTSVTAMSTVWVVLSSAQGQKEIVPKIDESDSQDSDVSIKEESDDESRFRVSELLKERRRSATKAIKEEQDIEESTTIEPLVSKDLGEAGASTQSRPRSRQEHGRADRRRTRVPEDPDDS